MNKTITIQHTNFKKKIAKSISFSSFCHFLNSSFSIMCFCVWFPLLLRNVRIFLIFFFKSNKIENLQPIKRYDFVVRMNTGHIEYKFTNRFFLTEFTQKNCTKSIAYDAFALLRKEIGILIRDGSFYLINIEK